MNNDGPPLYYLMMYNSFGKLSLINVLKKTAAYTATCVKHIHNRKTLIAKAHQNKHVLYQLIHKVHCKTV